MSKMLEIKRCFDCIYRVEEEFHDYCKMADKDMWDLLLDVNLPDWCPLPDYPIEATNKPLQELYIKCPVCDGYGYTAEHSGDSDCLQGNCSSCPIQVQCDNCKATGFILATNNLTTKEGE